MITIVDGTQYWIRELASGEWVVNPEAPRGAEWSGRPWWTQISGPYTTGQEAQEWLLTAA